MPGPPRERHLDEFGSELLHGADRGLEDRLDVGCEPNEVEFRAEADAKAREAPFERVSDVAERDVFGCGIGRVDAPDRGDGGASVSPIGYIEVRDGSATSSESGRRWT